MEAGHARTARDAPWDICRISSQTNLDIAGTREFNPKTLTLKAKIIFFVDLNLFLEISKMICILDPSWIDLGLSFFLLEIIKKNTKKVAAKQKCIGIALPNT